MAQTMVGVRKFLNDQGYKDQDITYDPNRKMVQVGGKDFYGATPDSDGSTYGTYDVLVDSLKNFRNMQQQNDLYNTTQKMVQQTQVQPFQYQAPAAFSYNPNSDPQYQAALRQAKRNTKKAAGDIAADMNKRGLLNSTITQDRGNQAAQQNYGYVTDTLLPEYNQQAYQQWADQANRDLQVQQANYGAQQDQFRNTATVADFLNGLIQQQFQNQMTQEQADRQRKLDNEGVAQWYTQTYGVPFDQKEDWGLLAEQAKGLKPLSAVEQAFQQMMQEAGLTGMYKGQPTMQKQAQDFNQWSDRQQLGISQQNANTSAASAGNSANNAYINQLMDIWQSTGVAPAGLEAYGVQQGTPLAGKTSQTDKFNLDDYKGFINQNFVSSDPYTGQKSFDSQSARRYIISLGLPDDQTDQLLKIYGLPTN